MAGPNLNKVFLIGRLTRDPELRYTPSGQSVSTLGFAVNHDYVTKEGRKEETCYVNLVIWGKRAEVCAEYLRKGSLIFVEGRLQFRRWETQENEKRSTIEVHVEDFQFLDKPNSVIPQKEEVEDGKEES